MQSREGKRNARHEGDQGDLEEGADDRQPSREDEVQEEVQEQERRREQGRLVAVESGVVVVGCETREGVSLSA